MPHLIIEYTQQLAEAEQVEVMLDAVHAALAATSLFDETHIRVRAIPLRHYRIAGRNAHFIHAQCRIHPGRNDEQKRSLSAAILKSLKGQQWPATSITVEVVEMDRATYAKHSSD